MVYLALYKGKGTAMNALVRYFTKSAYSHCEIAIDTKDGYGNFHCYSASLRDGGVRHKTMPLPKEKWHLIPVLLSPEWVKRFYGNTQGKKYDFLGVIGTVLGIPHSKSRYFCSEWAAECLGYHRPASYTPCTLSKKVKAEYFTAKMCNQI